MKIAVFGNYPQWLIRFRGPMLKRMAEKGHSVYACAPSASEDVNAQLADIGVRYAHIPLRRANLNPLNNFKTFICFYQFLLKIKPEYLFVYTVKPVILGSLAAKLAGTDKIVSMIEGLGFVFTELEESKINWLRVFISFFYRLSLKCSSKIFFLNQDDYDYFLKSKLIDKNQGVVLDGIGVDLEYYYPVSLPEQISFVMIARLIKEKGVCEYVRAAEIIKQDFPWVKFTLVGEVDEHPSSLSSLELEQLLVKNCVNYLGRLEDIRPAIRAASVYVLPSYREGLSRTIQEAMAMARPIITTEAPGCRQTVINGVNGYKVPVRNVQRLAEAMKKFIINPELAGEMGHQSRTIAEARFNEDDITDKIMSVMELE